MSWKQSLFHRDGRGREEIGRGREEEALPPLFPCLPAADPPLTHRRSPSRRAPFPCPPWRSRVRSTPAAAGGGAKRRRERRWRAGTAERWPGTLLAPPPPAGRRRRVGGSQARVEEEASGESFFFVDQSSMQDRCFRAIPSRQWIMAVTQPLLRILLTGLQRKLNVPNQVFQMINCHHVEREGSPAGYGRRKRCGRWREESTKNGPCSTYTGWFHEEWVYLLSYTHLPNRVCIWLIEKATSTACRSIIMVYYINASLPGRQRRVREPGGGMRNTTRSSLATAGARHGGGGARGRAAPREEGCGLGRPSQSR